MKKIALALTVLTSLISSAAFASECNVMDFDLVLKTSKEHRQKLEKVLTMKGYKMSYKEPGLVITAGVVEKPEGKPEKPEKPQYKQEKEDSGEEIALKEELAEAASKVELVRYSILRIDSGKKTIFEKIEKISPKDDAATIVNKAIFALPKCGDSEEI